MASIVAGSQVMVRDPRDPHYGTAKVRYVGTVQEVKKGIARVRFSGQEFMYTLEELEVIENNND